MHRLRPAHPALTHSQELKLSDQLFGLYVDVLETLAEWKHVRFSTFWLALLFRLYLCLEQTVVDVWALPPFALRINTALFPCLRHFQSVYLVSYLASFIDVPTGAGRFSGYSILKGCLRVFMAYIYHNPVLAQLQNHRNKPRKWSTFLLLDRMSWLVHGSFSVCFRSLQVLAGTLIGVGAVYSAYVFLSLLCQTLVFNQVPWSEVVSNIANMTDKMDNFAARCKKLPGRLKQWDAFTQLRSAHAGNVVTPKDYPV